MKIPLTMVSVPMAISFLSGMFDWYIDDGLFILFGFTMIAGLVWAWVVELKK